MNLSEISEIVTTTFTTLSALTAAGQYVWNSRPHYHLLKEVHSYSIGEPKDSLSISIANTGTLKLNVALKGITINKMDGEGHQFIGAVNFSKAMTHYKTFEPNEVKSLIDFTSQEFYQLISYQSNLNFLKIIKKLISDDAVISFYVWAVDYKDKRQPIKVILKPTTTFYQNLKYQIDNNKQSSNAN